MYVRWLGLAALFATWTLLARAEAPSVDGAGPSGLALPVALPDPAPRVEVEAAQLDGVEGSAAIGLVAATRDAEPARIKSPRTPAAESAITQSSSAGLAAMGTSSALARSSTQALTYSPGTPAGDAGGEPFVWLPIPQAPQAPEQPLRFEPPLHDPAGEPARAIARRVARFRTYRSEVPGATWRVAEAAVFRIRADAQCKRALREVRVPAHLVERELLTPVPSPVALDGPVAGVAFHSLHTDREVEMACELAVRLPAIAEILKRHGVRSVNVLSSYREEPRSSFHTFGLALDLASFRTSSGVLVVSKHFEMTLGQLTCDAQPSTEEGKVLLAIACDLAASNLVSSVLTPNYNAGHRDHFHLDIRPDDPRIFLR